LNIHTIKEISIDLYNRKIITVEAKQYDKFSRYLLVTCLDHGSFFPIEQTSVFAFIRYRKADELSVFNQCVITNEGKILVELTEQMLAAPGNCIADLLIIENELESFDIEPPIILEDGTIQTSNSILSTMKFCVNVIASPIENSEIESSYEYDALNQLIIKVTTDYKFVIEQARAHAEAAKESAENARVSEINAAESERNALRSEENALRSEQNAANSANIANTKAQEASNSANSASASANIATQKASEASTYSANAKRYSDTAALKASEAMTSANIATQKATAATNSALLAESYAHGETGIRIGENLDNAKYFYEQLKALFESSSGINEIMSSTQPSNQNSGDFWLREY